MRECVIHKYNKQLQTTTHGFLFELMEIYDRINNKGKTLLCDLFVKRVKGEGSPNIPTSFLFCLIKLQEEGMGQGEGGEEDREG